MKLVIILSLGISQLVAQCPDAAVQSNNNKCYTLSWSNIADVPASSPDIFVNNTDDNSSIDCLGSNATLSNDGLSYEYLCEGFNGNCSSGSGDGLNGDMDFGGELCQFNNGALPIEYITLSAEVNKSQVILTIHTGRSINVKTLSIEKSLDHITWNTLTDLPFINSSQPQTQQYTDRTPYVKGTYYRVKELDTDGKVIYSSVLYVNDGKALDPYTIYPNPSSDQM